MNEMNQEEQVTPQEQIERDFVHVISSLTFAINNLITFDGLDTKTITKATRFKMWVQSLQTPEVNKIKH
jgi:hypothetical protein